MRRRTQARSAFLISLSLILLAGSGQAQTTSPDTIAIAGIHPGGDADSTGIFFVGRGHDRRGLRRRYGGQGTAQAVDLGLAWLARHQTPDRGCWGSIAFQEQCEGEHCSGEGSGVYDPGITALSLLAFLGDGHTYYKGPYKKAVGNAIKYLKRIQGPEGCFGEQTGHFMYSHAVATLAMAEAYAMTNSPLLRRPVEKALRFIYRAQNTDPSGTGKLAWRYSVQPEENDTSVTSWVVMALMSARASGLSVPEEVLRGARRWIDRMTDPESGRVGYVQTGVSPVRMSGREKSWPRSLSEAITSAGMVSRIFLGESPDASRPIKLGTKLLLDRLPDWNAEKGSIDMYYWYYGTLAMFQVGGQHWATWNKALKRAVLDHQRKDGCERGSWDPAGPWGEEGGRVYATAVMTLCLEVYYRYGKLSGKVPDTGSREKIRVKLTKGPAGCTCTINGKVVGPVPACSNRAFEEIRRLKTVHEKSRVVIDCDSGLPLKHVLDVLDECIRVRLARSSNRKKSGFSEIQALGPPSLYRFVQRIRLIVEEEAKHGPGLPHLPGSSMGEHDKSRDKDMLTVNIIRDENTGVCKILVRGDVYTRNDLLAWMYPRARIKINPKTKLSEVPVLIRCDRDAPFRMVQKVLAICAHKDIQICKVMLAVAED